MADAPRSILLTGGTGTFGHAFVRLALEHGLTERIGIFSRDELKQAQMAERFPGEDGPGGRLRFLLGDVRDHRRLELAMRGCDTVVHAAALKRAPTLEYNPLEAIKTNALGTANIIEAAVRTPSVTRVVALSSDKACAPLNLYGATKLCVEKLVAAASAYTGSRAIAFASCRYGNVTGSRGSVVPTWRAALRAGRPITITAAAATRYWMTIDEAVAFVWLALMDARGGEVFIPMLPGYTVGDLASAMVPPGELVPAERTGLRPGEKMHESLFSADEAPFVEDAGSHYVLRAHPVSRPQTGAYTSAGALRLTVEQLRERLAVLHEETT